MGGCCSTGSKGGAAVDPAARPARPQQPTGGAQGQPVLLEQQGTAASSTKAEQLKATGAEASPEAAAAAAAGAAGTPPLGESEGLSVDSFKQRLSSSGGGEERSSAQVKVLTYNLFWWNLYGQRNGDNGSASKLIAAAMPDVIGCQECDDITRVLYEGNLQGVYTAVRGPHSLGIAYKTCEFTPLAQGWADVATDEAQQFYGSRGVGWVRLQHKRSGKVVFFMNHHGPLRVNSGGREGGPWTAYKIVKEIYDKTQPRDVVILVGDFNAQAGSQTVHEIEHYLPRAFTGTSFGGVDHVFSYSQMSASENLGSGGSDHDALTATFLI